MKKRLFGFALTLLSGSLMAEPLPVTASFSILGDVAKQIGGERVTVQNIIAPGQDAHVYTMSNADVRKIRQAKVLLLNGLGFERANLVRAAEQSKVPLFYAAANIKALSMPEDEHGHDDHDHELDPHVWQDPVLMKDYAKNVADALIQADAAGKVYYQRRLKNFQAELNQLDVWTKQTFNTIPESKRKVITSHDAFNYLGNRYHVQFLAPQGVSEEAEPSAKQVAAIIRQIKQRNIKAVFTENIKNPRVIERIAKETGVKVNGVLYADSLSAGAPAATYIQMFRYNVKALSDAMK
ncbi:metal ABC transporter solute-binding protein, Zn/Mn family [Stenoxybacter acetivorans]|uniref:metal ABC transporter solute-binding protein, Zn/Mn family n=1 Tax=Stenoxybacter acetivorans TaxID=422441 RepID=UPI00056000B1|nr:zinc ABC transporter substrate-binding protein [Stenoxybacter acetivorans]